MKNIPPLDILKNTPFSVPSHWEQVRIVDKYKYFMSEIDKHEECIQKQVQLIRLIPKAVVDAIENCKAG